MTRLARVLTLIASLFVFAPAVSCGSAAPVKPAGVAEVAAPRPKPRNAANIAETIAGSKLSALVYAERARDHAIADKIAALDLWQPWLEGTGIDPKRDLDRAFVASSGTTRQDRVVVVAQHSLPADRIKTSLTALMAKSDPPGAWISGAAVPTARVTLRGHTRVVAIIEPAFIVVLPESLAGEAKRFIGTGGFPDPQGPEVLVATVLDPSQTLKGPRVPPIPATISRASAKVTLGEDGGADIAVQAQSTTEAQAALDAAALTEAVDNATSVRVAIIKVRMFKPVEFRADGAQVKADIHLTQDEIDQLFSLASAFIPR
jgi:hypothetical protein